MRAHAGLLLALLIACSGEDDDDDTGSNSAGSGGGSVTAMGTVDCSDADENQTLSCSAPESCCALPNAENQCGTSCSSTVVLRCDDDSDCNGATCCWNRNGTTGSECQQGCDSGFAPLCTRSSDCPNDTPCCLGAEINGVMVRFCIEEQDFACL